MQDDQIFRLDCTLGIRGVMLSNLPLVLPSEIATTIRTPRFGQIK
jgi:hypothetical protein